MTHPYAFPVVPRLAAHEAHRLEPVAVIRKLQGLASLIITLTIIAGGLLVFGAFLEVVRLEKARAVTWAVMAVPIGVAVGGVVSAFWLGRVLLALAALLRLHATPGVTDLVAPITKDPSGG